WRARDFVRPLDRALDPRRADPFRALAFRPPPFRPAAFRALALRAVFRLPDVFFRAVFRLPPPDERAELFAAFFAGAATGLPAAGRLADGDAAEVLAVAG